MSHSRKLFFILALIQATIFFLIVLDVFKGLPQDSNRFLALIGELHMATPIFFLPSLVLTAWGITLLRSALKETGIRRWDILAATIVAAIPSAIILIQALLIFFSGGYTEIESL